MRIGTIGYRTRTGLGYQVLSYTKHLPITKVMVVDLSGYNGMPLTDWYPQSQTVKGYPKYDDLTQFLDDLDVVLLAETPLNYELYKIARYMNVKTAVVPNFEFFDHFEHPEYDVPDLFISPSMWRYRELEHYAKHRRVQCTYIHHPVDRDEFPYRERSTYATFHIAGRPAAHDRNGTWEFLKAQPNGRVITQSSDLANMIRRRYPQSRVLTNIDNAKDMYDIGDILVFPRRYGGNCLPLNEALSCGVPVIMPDIEPNNHILPKEWLVPAYIYDRFKPRTEVDIYTVEPEALVQKIEWFKSTDMREQSRKANAIANTISWEVLKPKFMEALQSLVGARV